MSTPVFLLIIFSAVFHAAWNLAARKVSGNFVIVWLGMWIGTFVGLPAVATVYLTHDSLQPITLTGWLCILATGIIHSFYFRLLAAAYAHGEITLVYPIARGSGVALTGLLAFIWLKEPFSLFGVLGILLISMSILFLGKAQLKEQLERQRQHGKSAKAILLALSVGLCIVSYSLVDDLGVQHVHPVIYIAAMYPIATLLLTPYVIKRYWGQLRQTTQGKLKYSAIIGIGSMGTYLLILYAYSLGPVGYVVAARESAVIMGTIAGVIFLKERFTVIKGISILGIAIGIGLIKIG